VTQEEIRSAAEHYLSVESYEKFHIEVENSLKNNLWDDLEDRFYKELDFGTGGLRGVIGGGYNRMNPYTVAKATEGLALYISKNVPVDKQTVCISFDCRNFSDLFAETAARVLATKGIKVFLFTSLRPTPELSFAVRHLSACAGIMVTASHNPAKYNGYKVFWDDGAQVTPPHDTGIIQEVRAVDQVPQLVGFEEAKSAGMVVLMDELVDKPYIDMVKSQALRPELIKQRGKDLKIVYTPLHGAGRMPVERSLSEMGIEVFTVPEQAEPDGDFSTVAFPNPEIAPAMDLSLQYAKKQKADLVMGTDPDSDRLGIAVPDGDQWVLISGNQLGALLADYIFKTRKELGTLPVNSAFVNTIVTTDLQIRIAKSYGAETFKVLTGFKYIGEKIHEFEEKGNFEYLFGGEESYGFLVGTAVRDKDAVSAATMTAEMALWNVAQGRSILDHLKEIYSTHGYFEELLISQYFEGMKGAAVMDQLMKNLRDNPPHSFGMLKVAKLLDYRDGSTLTMADGKKEKNIPLPSSNVLQFLMEDGSLVTARPSGTEPKIKFYASCCVDSFDNLEEAKKQTAEKLQGVKDKVQGLIAQVQ
jgi:phosphoglucomutase